MIFMKESDGRIQCLTSYMYVSSQIWSNLQSFKMGQKQNGVQ
jgi:hypothetical protein